MLRRPFSIAIEHALLDVTAEAAGAKLARVQEPCSLAVVRVSSIAGLLDHSRDWSIDRSFDGSFGAPDRSKARSLSRSIARSIHCPIAGSLSTVEHVLWATEHDFWTIKHVYGP